MAKVELNIVALGDFASVSTQIKNLQTQIVALQKNLAGVGVSSTLAKDLSNINASFKQTMLSTGQFTASTVAMASETERFGTALVAGKLKLSDYYNIIKMRSSEAVTQMKALALEQTKLQNSLIINDPTKQGILSVYTPTQINKVANATKIAANEANLYAIAVNKGSQQLINFGKNTQWAGRQLTVGMSVPLMIFGQQATQVFKDVNDQIVRLQKVYGTGLVQPSQQALETIKTQTLALGKELAASMGISVKDTAAMAADLAATGKTGTDLITATREAMRLSKLGEMDTQQALQTTISLQNVYKLNTNELSNAINFLNAVENQTSTSLQDLAAGIPKVGPIVQQLGGSFKDTAVMMVAMKEAGVPAAQSANAIKSAIASLINPTSAAQKAFKAYNIDLKSIATNEKGNPIKMIMDLQQALKGLAPLAQSQLIEKLFGKFQEARIQALITNLGAANSQTKTAFDLMNANSAQLASVAAGEMKTATESVTGKYQRAIQTFKADLIPVGQELIKIATKLLDFGNAVAKVFSGLPGPLKTVMGAIAIGVALAGPIIMLTGLLANFAGYVMRGVFNLKQLATGGRTLGQLLTPELIAAQNASQIFNSDILTNVDSVELLSKAIGTLTLSIESMVSSMNVGTGISSVLSTVGAAAAVEAKTYKQMHLPGFAGGGIVSGPGTGTSDSILARVSNGETILTEKQTKDNIGFINAIINGKKLPGFHKGRRPHTHIVDGEIIPKSQLENANHEMVQAHTAAPISQSTFEGSSGSNTIVSDQTSPLPNWLNALLRPVKGAKGPQGVTKDEFASGWDEVQNKSHFFGTASRHGVGSDDESRKALQDLSDNIKQRIVSSEKALITDEDLAEATKKEIEAFKNGTVVQKKVAAALEEAAAMPTQRRTNPGKDLVVENIKSGKWTQPNPKNNPAGRGTKIYDENGNYVAQEYKPQKNAPLEKRTIRETKETFPKNNPSGLGFYQNPTKEAQKVEAELNASAVRAEREAEVAGEKIGKAVHTGFKKGTGSNSASIKAEQTMIDFGDGASIGAEKIIPQVTKDGSQIGETISKATAQAITDTTSTVSNAMVTQTEEVAKVAQSRLSVITSKLKGKGSLAGGMGAMMAGQMLSGQSGILGAVGGAASTAGMASMAMPAISGAAGALGLATPGVGEVMMAVGAMTLAYKGVNQIIKGEQAAQAQAAATFSSSSEMATFFGGVLQDTSSHLNNIALSYDGIAVSAKRASTTMGVSNTQIAAFVNMSKSLPKDNPISLIMDKLKGTHGSAAGEFAKAFIDMQVAIGNIDPKKAQQALDLLLASSGNSDQIGKSSAALSQSSAVTSAIKSAQKIGGGGSGILAHTFNDALGFVYGGFGGLSDAENRRSQGKQKNIDAATSKAIADPLNSAINTHSLDRIKQVVAGITAANLGASRSFNIFKASLASAADQRKVEILKSYGMNLEQIAKVLSYLQAGQNVDLTKGLGGVDFKKIDEFLKNWKDPATTTPAITAAKAVGTTLDKQLANNKAQITALEAKKKVIDAELKAQRDITSEMQRQHDYTTSQVDLQNKANEALIHGDYVTAATLNQQKSYATMQFNQQTKAVGLQGQSDVLAQKIADLNDKQTILSDAINNNSTKVQNLTDALSKNPPAQKPPGEMNVPMTGPHGANTTPTVTNAIEKMKKAGTYSSNIFNKTNLDPSAWGDTTWWDSARQGIKKYAKTMGYGYGKNADGSSNGKYDPTKNLFEIDHNKIEYMFKVLKDGNIQMEGKGKVGQVWDPKTGKFVSPSVNIPTPSVKSTASVSSGSGNTISAATGSTVNSVTIQVNGNNMDAQTVANTVFDKVKTHLAVSGAKVNSTNKVKP